MQQDIYNTTEEILEIDSHADTWIMGKVWRNMVVNDYSVKDLEFSDDIGQLYLPIVDSATTVGTEIGNGIIIWINQALS